MHCDCGCHCANEAVAPPNDTAAALSTTPPATARAIANFVTVVCMFFSNSPCCPAPEMAPRPPWCNAQLFERAVMAAPLKCHDINGLPPLMVYGGLTRPGSEGIAV